MPILRERVVLTFRGFGESSALQAGILTAILGGSFILPTHGLGIETCWWHALLGFKCPACGLTRSFIAVAHGDLADGFHHHWVGPPLFVFFLVMWADRLLRTLKQRPLLACLETGKPFSAIFFAIAFSWIIRLALGCTINR